MNSRNFRRTFHTLKNFRITSNIEKIFRTSVSITKKIVIKKRSVSFNVYLCLVKFQYNLYSLEMYGNGLPELLTH